MKLNHLPITAGLCAVALSASATEERDWTFDISPYVWVANVSLESNLAGSGSGSSVERFETQLTAGAMLTAAVHYRSVGILVDAAWARLDTKAVSPGPVFSAVDLQSDIVHTTAALTYALPLKGKLHAELLAGARVWYVANEFKASSNLSPGFSANSDSTWADPIVGGTVSYDFAKRWSANVKGTIGGFGVSADIAGEVFAGVSYRITDWCSATLGYRYLHEEYDRGNHLFNLDAQGFLVGLGFHF